MAYEHKYNALRKKEAVGMEALVQEFIREMKIAGGLNSLRAREAWDAVSGMSRYTLDVNLDRGVMYCTLSSSLVRNQLYFQRDALLKSLNEYLENDELFVRYGNASPIVKSLVLR